MDKSFQTVLKIASDALSLRFFVRYSVLYWKNEEGQFEENVSLYLQNSGQELDASRFKFSESLIGAVRKPLIILKKGESADQLQGSAEHLKPFFQIIIPLNDGGNINGVIGIWADADSKPVSAADRQLLDIVGMMLHRFLHTIVEGAFSRAGMGFPEEAPMVETGIETRPDEDDVGPVEIAEFEQSTSAADEPLEVAAASSKRSSSQNKQEQPAVNEEFGLFLKYSGLGFLIFDRDCRIEHEHPLFTRRFFDFPYTEKSALELLFEWGEPSNVESASFEKYPDFEMIRELMTTVFERVTDIDVLTELLPVEMVIGESTCRLDYYYLKSGQTQSQDRILVVFNNITNEVRLTEKCNLEKERANMIIKVALDVDGYYQYRHSTEAIFEKINAELGKPEGQIRFDAILHHLQAVQGGAEIFEINEVIRPTDELIIVLEELLNRDQPAGPAEIDQLKEKLEALQDIFQTLQTRYLDNLVSDEQILDKTVYRVTQTKIQKTREEIIEGVLKKSMKDLEAVFEKNYRPFTHLKRLEDITEKRLNRIKNHIRNHVVDPCSKEVEALMMNLRKQPIGLLFKRYAIIAVNLGERLKKRVEVDVKGADVEVPFHTLEHLFSSLTFVIRNSVEHGIETMEERIAQNKSLEGNISIEASMAEEMLTITIKDDGRGIDIEKIKQSAIKNGVIDREEAETLSHQSILMLMFNRGFSTKRDSAGTFGRGVGLSAAGAAAKELGGTVSIRTELKKGTTFKVKVPLENS